MRHCWIAAGFMARKIFVNYRRDDSGAHALAVAQFLEREFGAANVFIDVDRIRAGQEFPVVLKQKLDECRALVAVIGPRWLTVVNERGERRIDDLVGRTLALVPAEPAGRAGRRGEGKAEQ